MKTEVVRLRCTAADKARWLEQAGSRTLTNYLTFLLDSDGGRGAQPEPPPTVPKPKPARTFTFAAKKVSR